MTRSPNPAETGEAKSENLLPPPNLGLAEDPAPLAAVALVRGGAEEPVILDGVEIPTEEEAMEALLAVEKLFLVLIGSPLCRAEEPLAVCCC